MNIIDARKFIDNRKKLGCSDLYWLYIIERYLEPYDAKLDYDNLNLDRDEALISSQLYPILAHMNTQGYLSINHNFLSIDVDYNLESIEKLIEPNSYFKTLLENCKVKDEDVYRVDLDKIVSLERDNIGTLSWSSISYLGLHLLAIYIIEEVLHGHTSILILDINSTLVDQLQHLSILYYVLDGIPLKTSIQLFGLSNDKLVALGVTSWVTDGKDRGYLTNDSVEISEKKRFVNESPFYEIGSVVYLYERKKTFISQSSNSYISSVKIAIIRDINPREIILQVVATSQTKDELEYNFNSQPMAVLEMYNYEVPVKTFRIETYDWTSIGIEYLMGDKLHSIQERHFIMPLQDKGEGMVTQRIKDLNDNIVIQSMSYNLTVYHILKSYGLKFNEDKFKEDYLTSGEIENLC